MYKRLILFILLLMSISADAQTITEQLKKSASDGNIALVVVSSRRISGTKLFSDLRKSLDEASLPVSKFGVPDVYLMDKDAPGNDSITAEYKLDMPVLPLILIFSHKGDFVNVIMENEFKAETLLSYMPTYTYSKIINNIINRKSQIALFSTPELKGKKESLELIDKVNDKFDNTIVVYDFDLNDDLEKTSFARWGVKDSLFNSDAGYLQNDSVFMVILSPLGNITKRFTGIPTEQNLIEALLEIK